MIHFKKKITVGGLIHNKGKNEQQIKNNLCKHYQRKINK